MLFVPLFSKRNSNGPGRRTPHPTVKYEIRGPLAQRAEEIEQQGHPVLKCNIGNPGAFGFEAPQVVIDAIKANINKAVPYEHQKGLPEARRTVMEKYNEVCVVVIGVLPILCCS